MPVTVDDVIAALRPVEDPSCTARSSTSTWSGRAASTATPWRWRSPSRWPAARSATRSSRGSPRPSPASASPTSTCLRGDDRRGAPRCAKLHGDPSATAGSQAAHGHAEGRAIPFADPSSTTRVLLDRVGQGRRRQVVGHHEPLGRARAARHVAVIDADVWGFSIPRMLGVEHPPAVIDSMLVPPPGPAACAASRWASSPRRTSR